MSQYYFWRGDEPFVKLMITENVDSPYVWETVSDITMPRQHQHGTFMLNHNVFVTATLIKPLYVLFSQICIMALTHLGRMMQ